MRNLLNETKEILKKNDKKLEDIKWVGCKNFYVDVEDFIKLSDTYYDNSYGYTNVAEDLLIVGDNWWLERHEYDGSEWWEYKSLPIKPQREEKLKALTTKQSVILGFDDFCSLDSLSGMNGLERKVK